MTIAPGDTGHVAEHNSLRLAVNNSDATTAARVDDTGTATGAALAATFSAIRPLDPRAFGAIGDNVADDTVAIQACIDAAGASGVVELPPLAFKITATLNLLSGTELRGTGEKASRLIVSTDIVAIKAIGGQGQALKNLKVWNIRTGARTTYDIVFVNPTKPVIEDVEVDLQNTSTGAGGIHFVADVGEAGNTFMPQLSRVWIRNGHLVVDGITDGKVSDSFVWAPGTSAPGAIQMVNSASSWTFSDVDVVPPVGDFAGYYLNTVENIQIQGGLVDGSYSGIMTGWGVRAIDSYRITCRTAFWNLGRGAIDLDGCQACSFTGNVISRSNKEDNFYPDIRVVDSRYNVFVANTHSAQAVRTNKGKVYVESGTSTDNIIDLNVMESNVGSHYYDTATVTVTNDSVLGTNNRPSSAWPQIFSRTINSTAFLTSVDVFHGYSVFATNTITLTLPGASTVYSGARLPIKNIGTGIVTIAPFGSDTIDGSTASTFLYPGQSMVFTSSASTAWRVMSGVGGASGAIAPPASLYAVGAAAAWPTTNMAILHRFTLTQPGTYRYANFRIDSGSGNVHAAVLRVEGTAYTRVMTSGVIAATTGDKVIDLGLTRLDAGEYALALWFDNTTVTARPATNSGVTASRLTAEFTDAAGIPASGTLTWGSTRYVGGFTLTP